MSEQFNMPFIPDYQADKNSITQVGTLAEVAINDMTCGFGDDVETYRAVEILERLEAAWNHMRDNNMLSSASGPLYVNIDMDTLAVSQNTSFINVQPTDVFVGIGASVNVAGESASQMMDSAFRMLREWMSENYFKKV